MSFIFNPVEKHRVSKRFQGKNFSRGLINQTPTYFIILFHDRLNQFFCTYKNNFNSLDVFDIKADAKLPLSGELFPSFMCTILLSPSRIIKVYLI